jgi:hypothetical protein
MDKTNFLVLYPTFKRVLVVKRVLPSVIDEVKTNDARLVVVDNSVMDADKRNYLLELRQQENFFLVLSDNTSYAHARNLGLRLGQELYAPNIICILDDDHGLKPGFIEAMTSAIGDYYGIISKNGLRYGMFTSCHVHTRANLAKVRKNLYYPQITDNQGPFVVAGANGCCRVAPTHHWNNVLKEYDTDEYPISTYQSSSPRWRNYQKGFTAMFVGKPGQYIFDIEEEGRGVSPSASRDEKLWDENYSKSDPRSEFLGKD